MHVVWEVDHDVLELEVSVNDKHLHHIVDARDKLTHNFVDDLRLQLPGLVVHEVFQVVSIAQLHKDVIAVLGLDGLAHVGHVLALHHVLV